MSESYCIKNRTRKNWLHDRWTEEFVKYAEKCPNMFYEDPDETHANGKNSSYYMQLVSFLNAREHILEVKLRDRWFYEMKGRTKGNQPPSGITVWENSIEVMYLRSDQFGFSAPKPKMKGNYKYPYVKYMMEANCLNKYKYVAEWIWNTRTVGGSFLWPIQYTGNRWQSLYSMKRGIRSYIQDREDLTLWEVLHFYEHTRKHGTFSVERYEWEDDILYIELNENPNMRKWLEHFGSFETFVEFFMLDDFVCTTNCGKLVPKNIISEEPLTAEYVNNVKSQVGVIQNLTVEKICTMLSNISRWTINRSESIENLLSTENIVKDNT